MYKWEKEDERLLRFMKISPQQKLEWLRKMNAFIYKFSSQEKLALRRKLKEERG